MDILWSPWRMEFIDPKSAAELGTNPPPTQARAEKQQPTYKQEKGCVFCLAPAQGPENDRANLILYRGEKNFIILNLYPYNTAHLMVVPYRHLDDVTLLTPEESAEMMSLLQRMVGLIRAEYKPEGFNAGMNLGRVAGAGIADHIHMHLVPRWGGDTNFMPVIGRTKVLPEALDQTYDRLKRALDLSS